MSRPKIRVGTVGASGVGGLGRRANFHAGGYRRCEEADLAAVADINPERLQQFGEEWEIVPEHRYILHAARNCAFPKAWKRGVSKVSNSDL